MFWLEGTILREFIKNKDHIVFYTFSVIYTVRIVYTNICDNPSIYLLEEETGTE
jgi:hypothetical protein